MSIRDALARRALIWAVMLLALTVGGLWAMQRRLIYFPEPSMTMETPAGWRHVTVTAGDGVTLGAWYRPPDPGAPVVIVFNGNAGNKASRLDLGLRLGSEGFGVVLFDYRGYGDSNGSPSERGLRLDARAIADFVDGEDTGTAVVYFGESLGAAVAADLATDRPPDVLGLRSPFVSLAEVAAVHYPLVPARLLLRDRYATAQHIVATTVPVLVIAGSIDTIVPIEQSRRIFELAPGPKELIVVEGADHNDARLAGSDALAGLVRFVREQT